MIHLCEHWLKSLTKQIFNSSIGVYDIEMVKNANKPLLLLILQ